MTKLSPLCDTVHTVALWSLDSRRVGLLINDEPADTWGGAAGNGSTSLYSVSQGEHSSFKKLPRLRSKANKVFALFINKKWLIHTFGCNPAQCSMLYQLQPLDQS